MTWLVRRLPGAGMAVMITTVLNCRYEYQGLGLVLMSITITHPYLAIESQKSCLSNHIRKTAGIPVNPEERVLPEAEHLI